MPLTVGAIRGNAGTDDHIEIVADQSIDEPARMARIVGPVAVGHDVDVGVDIGEHPPHDVALSAQGLVAHVGPRTRRTACGRVGRRVVEDEDRGIGQGIAETQYDGLDCRLLVVARQQHRDRRSPGGPWLGRLFVSRRETHAMSTFSFELSGRETRSDMSRTSFQVAPDDSRNGGRCRNQFGTVGADADVEPGRKSA